jgi:hypothetical protein
MNMNEKFDDILNECLDRIIRGEPVEDCLKSYPDYARELEPLLRTASSAKIISTIQPKPEFKSRARSEFQAALRDVQAKRDRKTSRFSWRWNWQPAWSMAVASVAVVIIVIGSMAAASSYSMPDGALYSLKIATENVQLALTTSEIGKTELNAKFADRRVDEIIQMTSTGTSQEVTLAAKNLSVNMSNMANIAVEDTSGGAKLSDQLSGVRSANTSSGLTPVPGSTIPKMTTATTTAAKTVTTSATSTTASTTKVPDAAPAFSRPTENPASIMTAPNPETAQSATNESTHLSGSLDISGTGNSRVPELEKVREIIVNNYLNRQKRLEEALGKVSIEMRPLILQALDQSTLEFEKAIRNIDAAENAP